MRSKIFVFRTNFSAAWLIFLILGLGLSACTTLTSTERIPGTPEQGLVNQIWEESGQVSLPVDQGDSPLDIVQQGFAGWLSQYNQANTPLEARIDAFQIEQIEAVSDPFFGNEYDFVFRIEYSLQPAPSGLIRWLAGDGRQGQGGWVEGKMHYVGLRVVNDTATIYILGPCPMC